MKLCVPAKVHTKEFATMALSKSALSELLDALLQALIDAEATQQIGARPYERTDIPS